MTHPLDDALAQFSRRPPRGIIPHQLVDIAALVGQIADGLTLHHPSGSLRDTHTPAAIRHRRWQLDNLTCRCALWAAEQGCADPVQAIRNTHDTADSQHQLDAVDDDYQRVHALVAALGQVAQATPALDLADALIYLATCAAAWASTIPTLTTEKQP